MNNYLAVKIDDAFFNVSGWSLRDPEKIGTVHVSNFITAAISIAGIVFLFLLIGGGISIIAGSGTDDPEKMAKGKKAATSALVGFIVVIAAYWIVKLITDITGLPLL